MNIEIDDEVFAALQKEAVPLVDTPNDVLRRLLGLGSTEERAAAGDQVAFQPPLPRKSAQNEASPNRTTSTERAQRPTKSRRAAGELLSLEAYCTHILNALIARGGELRSREMPDALAPLLEPHLLVADQELDAEGIPVWHGRVGWAGSLCRKAGHLDPAAPRGTWRITDEGRKAAVNAKGESR